MSISQHSPFVPFIPTNAPFSNDQRAWLNGFLAGMFSNALTEPGQQIESQPGIPLTILFGTETGNSASLARKTAKLAEKAGFEVTLSCMSKYDPGLIEQEKNLLLVTSTYGDGEPPATAEDFYNFLHSDQAPEVPGLRYSVLALGDSSYPDFCKCGKDLDARLEQLNAVRLSPRVDCDVDFDEPFESWKSAVFDALGGTSTDTQLEETDEGDSYSKRNPFAARLFDNRNLNLPGSAKETRHLAFSLENSGLTYQPGDALGVYPTNCSDYASELLEVLGIDKEYSVNGKSILACLIEDFEITKLSPAYLNNYASVCHSDAFKSFLALEKKELLDYCWGRELIDLVKDFPAEFSKPEDFLDTLRKLAPRLYSISSSPLAHPGEVHLTVGAVRYKAHGRNRTGVCSTFLADRCGEGPVPIYFHRNENFRLPEDDSVPVIMIGPGTGIAPFRAFLEERTIRNAPGDNWLFFGDQHATSDFLYQDELKDLQSKGFLTRLDTAFSRDQEEKVYVQDRIREQGASLYDWLNRGACIYVCGDASRMAKDVDKALHEIVSKHGGLSEQDTVDFFKSLKSTKRYCRDVY